MRIREIMAQLEAQGRMQWPEGLSRMPDAYAQRVTARRFEAGRAILRDGDPAGSVFLLVQGRATAAAVQPDGEVYSFADFRAPAVFGEFEAFGERRWYRSTILCVSGCRVLQMPSDAYLQWVRGDAELLYARTRAMVRMLTRQARSERSLLFLNARQRLCLYLCDSAEPAGGRDGYIVEGTRRQIADRIGCCEKTVQREMARLAAESGVKLKRGRIILSETRLQALNAQRRRDGSESEEEGI